MCDVVGHGGGWGYSAHSVEAIRFCADADILLGGLGLFGGRGEYTAKIKVSCLETFFLFFINKDACDCFRHFVNVITDFFCLDCPILTTNTILTIAIGISITIFTIHYPTPFVVQLFELGPDGGDHETDGDLLAETDVLAYDCAAR